MAASNTVLLYSILYGARTMTEPFTAVVPNPLNPAQQQAATHGVNADSAEHGRPLLVIAGAGTGKTNTLSHRVANALIAGVAPERILLMTFSRRAAAEMIQRAESIIARSGSRFAQSASAVTRQLWAGTFHAIGHRLLREYAGALGIADNFSILDRGDSADLIDILRHELGFASSRQRFPRKDTCLAIYSYRVNTGATLEDAIDNEFPWCSDWRDELNSLFRAYVAAKQKQQLLDYDDLLLYWQLLMQEPQLAPQIGARFDHVLVDEFQDTNRLQADILRSLKPDGRGLCVVGDDAQSIYSFRAASVENILCFPEQFSPPARVITLTRNYRSTQPILDLANSLMSEAKRSYQKQLQTPLESAQRPQLVMVEDDRSQAIYVADQILARREEGTLLRHQAVLMRKAHDSDILELELIRRDIPFVKYGGLKFLEAAHVKDMLAILRYADNPGHRLAGFRTLQLLPGVGPASADRCLQHVEAHGGSLAALRTAPMPSAAREDWTGLCELLIALSGARDWSGQVTQVRQWYEPHLERLHGNAHVRAGDLAQLEALSTQHSDRASFLSELTLDPPQSTGDEAGTPLRDDDYLILSTVHSAKGQEWDSVYLLNVVDGTFPNEFACDDEERLEEERRLLYVAMTRAKRHLELMAPLKFYVTQQRRFGEKHLYGARSRFLTEAVMAQLDLRAWPPQPLDQQRPPERPEVRINAMAALRAMWD